MTQPHRQSVQPVLLVDPVFFLVEVERIVGARGQGPAVHVQGLDADGAVRGLQGDGHAGIGVGGQIDVEIVSLRAVRARAAARGGQLGHGAGVVINRYRVARLPAYHSQVLYDGYGSLVLRRAGIVDGGAELGHSALLPSPRLGGRGMSV